MALLMVHLLAAERWAQKHEEYRNCPDFYLGAISPDASGTCRTNTAIVPKIDIERMNKSLGFFRNFIVQTQPPRYAF